ncbi:MAG: DUF4065 domain-containing protein [Nitrospinae bacterium]|nr:DUF4065 domain-containing protein [Nitrospinota bacterium]
MPALAKYIQHQRKKRNLAQDHLAKRLGISRPTFIQIEKGERALTVPEAHKLSEIFGIPLSDFLRCKDEPDITVSIMRREEKTKVSHGEIRISIPQQKAGKFRQVLLYILNKVGGKPNIGMTALYKLLYFIDFDYYEKYEEQLMGMKYQKNTHGPTPVLFKKFIEEMIKKKEVEEIKSEFYKYPQVKYLPNPNIAPDLSVLNGREKEHIDWELQRLSDMTASQLSWLSHRDVPWISAEEGDTLDYEAVFYRTPETSVREYEGAAED